MTHVEKEKSSGNAKYEQIELQVSEEFWEKCMREGRGNSGMVSHVMWGQDTDEGAELQIQ